MLLLRKSCQEVLDAHGLDMLHIEVQNKYLCIVGECGKNIVSINGINFTKSKINENERDYATELFYTFIKKYKKKLKALINARKALKDSVKPKTPEFGTLNIETLYINGVYRKKENTLKCKAKIDGYEFNFTVKEKGIKLNDYVTIGAFSIIDSILSPYIREALLFIQALDEYEKLEETVKEVENDIQSCNI